MYNKTRQTIIYKLDVDNCVLLHFFFVRQMVDEKK